jgi:hypothetical protein
MRRAVILFLALLTFAAGAQTLTRTGTSNAPKVTPAASAAEQIARAVQLIQQMERTPPPKKFDFFAEAWSNLSLVRKVWPNDKSAFLRSGVMQADLAAELGVWPKVVETLVEVEPVAATTDAEPPVEQCTPRTRTVCSHKRSSPLSPRCMRDKTDRRMPSGSFATRSICPIRTRSIKSNSNCRSPIRPRASAGRPPSPSSHTSTSWRRQLVKRR